MPLAIIIFKTEVLVTFLVYRGNFLNGLTEMRILPMDV